MINQKIAEIKGFHSDYTYESENETTTLGDKVVPKKITAEEAVNEWLQIGWILLNITQHSGPEQWVGEGPQHWAIIWVGRKAT